MVAGSASILSSIDQSRARQQDAAEAAMLARRAAAPQQNTDAWIRAAGSGAVAGFAGTPLSTGHRDILGQGVSGDNKGRNPFEIRRPFG